MANITWIENKPTWTALLDNVPVCTLRTKDIGGCTADWLDGRMWAPPAHMPKATPQTTRFFGGVDEAKQAVELALRA